MKYNNIVKGKFVERKNRFIADVIIDGEIKSVHVKNTGRCKELLVPGYTVYLEDFINNMRTRKMRYDLISVEKELSCGEILLVNMDSQVPNKVVYEGLRNEDIKLPNMAKLEVIRPETFYIDSRFDFYIKDENGKEGFLEVKGVTLENDGICSFPDSVTERGKKHMLELVDAKNNGYESYALFLVQMDNMREFRPAYDHDIDFSNALKYAKESGVIILVYGCKVFKDCIKVDKIIKSNI